VVSAEPSPLLHLASGHVVLLSAAGKYPVALPPGIEGHGAEGKGWLLHRGSLEVLQLTDELRAVDLPVAAMPVEDLGTWRLTGEICDGKCYAGAMRPGRGIAHRACANLCLIEAAPPVFVTTAPIAGTSFLLMADPAGARLPDAVLNLVGLRVRLDGKVERRGDVLVFKTDLATAVVP
jgi:hypothetical protein